MANLSSYLPDGIDESSVAITGGTINGTTIGASTPSTGAFTSLTATAASTITTADNNPQLTLISTDADASEGPVLKLYRNSGSPADNDILGRIQFSGEDDAGNDSTFGRIDVVATDVSNDSEDARMEFSPAVGDAFTPTMSLTGGNVGIGTTSPSDKLHVYSGSSSATAHSYTQLHVENGSHAAIQISTPTNAEAALWFADADDAAAGGVAYTHSSNALYFRANGGERMRITSGGDVGIGTTSPAAKLHIDTSGTGLKCTGPAVFGADAHTKLTTYSDTNYVGIYNGSSLTADEAIYMGGDHIYFYAYNTEAARLNSSHLYGRNVFPFVDNTYDLGGTSSRWDDVYATNSSIQTSDAREKQDVEELTEAETRVAVAAKALLRKYRWKNAVEAKDNNPDSDEEARIHFGIVAQDLKAAFEAEGLDAGRYGMFIHSTWTDEETGEERDLMGVRYSELLAFIIAAI